MIPRGLSAFLRLCLKPVVGTADSGSMDEDLKKAGRKAGIKLAGGILVIAAVIGIRVVTADPGGINGQIAELDAIESELARDADERGVEAPRQASDDSFMARLVATVRENLPLASAKSGPDAERLVSCRLGSSTQFMRAADCLSRGGDSTDFKSSK